MTNETAIMLMAMGYALGTVAREALRMQRIREHNARVDARRWKSVGDARPRPGHGGPVGRG